MKKFAYAIGAMDITSEKAPAGRNIGRFEHTNGSHISRGFIWHSGVVE
jgi:hypothetical protein